MPGSGATPAAPHKEVESCPRLASQLLATQPMPRIMLHAWTQQSPMLSIFLPVDNTAL